MKNAQRVVRTIEQYYRKNGRHDLPWRTKTSPYRVVVSEIMLQQTQVDRVVPKFTHWMRQFPSWKALANAPRQDVLLAWQGLGYNSRAIRLHKLAKIVVDKHGGRIPREREALRALPGIGPYTSGAILAFAYNQPVVFIDTNIRRIVLHHFFKNAKSVADTEIAPILQAMLEKTKLDPRDWYSALMDYGTHLGKTLPKNPNTQSRHYAKQSRFAGSDRQVRGAIIRALTKKSKVAMDDFLPHVDGDIVRLKKIVRAYEKEGMIVLSGKHITLRA